MVESVWENNKFFKQCSNLTEAVESGVKHNVLGKVSFILFILLHESQHRLLVFTLVASAKANRFTA